jgi:hypothetical protein
MGAGAPEEMIDAIEQAFLAWLRTWIRGFGDPPKSKDRRTFDDVYRAFVAPEGIQ